MSGELAPLGRLVQIPIGSVWPLERGFSDWLASPENLELLGAAIDTPLVAAAREGGVGDFSVDLVCRVAETDESVVIENQVGRSDHGHLGQLLTYASGMKARIVIWITTGLRAEHAAAINWLNEISSEGYAFFGIEMQLWRIGDSAPAPRFQVVARPNSWSRAIVKAVSQRAPAVGIDLNRERYWEAFGDVLATSGSSLQRRDRGPRQGFYWFPITGVGRAGLYAYRDVASRTIGVYVSIGGDGAGAFFDAMQAEQTEIERELGEPLHWEIIKPGSKYRITADTSGNPLDETDWPRQHAWLAEQLNRFVRYLVPRVKAVALHLEDQAVSRIEEVA